MRLFGRWGRAVLSAAAVAAVAVLAGCASRYWSKPIPKRIQRYYTDTVYVNASAEELLRQLGVFAVQSEVMKKKKYDYDLPEERNQTDNEGDGYRLLEMEGGLSAYAARGRYKIDLPKVAVWDIIQELKTYDIEVKRAILAEPLTDAQFAGLMEQGRRRYDGGDYKGAQKYFYQAAMGRPSSDDALIMYGSSLMGRRKSSRGPACFCYAAVQVLELLGDNETAQEKIEIALDTKDAVENERRLYAQRKDQERQESAEKWARVADAMNATANVLNATVEAYNAANSSAGGGYGGQDDLGGGGSGNCSYWSSRYSQLQSMRNNDASSNATRKGHAAAKNTLNSIDPGSYDAATSGDHRVINQSSKNIRGYQREMDKISRQARKAGCPGF